MVKYVRISGSWRYASKFGKTVEITLNGFRIFRNPSKSLKGLRKLKGFSLKGFEVPCTIEKIASYTVFEDPCILFCNCENGQHRLRASRNFSLENISRKLCNLHLLRIKIFLTSRFLNFDLQQLDFDWICALCRAGMHLDSFPFPKWIYRGETLCRRCWVEVQDFFGRSARYFDSRQIVSKWKFRCWRLNFSLSFDEVKLSNWKSKSRWTYRSAK